MDVENALGKLLHEPGGKQPHVSRQANEIDLVLAKHRDHLPVVCLALLAFGRHHDRGNSHPSRHVEPTGVRHIRYRDRNASVGDFAACDILCDDFKVGASSGKQNANILHKVVSRWSSASGYSSTSQTSDNRREMQESMVSLRKASTYFVDNSCGC